MAAAKLDEGLLMQLVVTRLKTLTDFPIKTSGEPPEDGIEVDVAGRVLSLSVERQRRVSGGTGSEPDIAKVTLEIEVHVQPKASIADGAYVPMAAASLVADLFDEIRLEHGGSTHELEFDRATLTQLGPEDEETQAVVALVTVTGRAQRSSGTAKVLTPITP